MRLVMLLLGTLVMAAGVLASPGSSRAGAGGGCSGTAGSDVHRAGLVVTFADEQLTQRFCVEFTEDSISGIELLRRSGLSLVTQIEGGLGAGVCAINGVGSDDPTNCFKYSTTPPYRYWVYFRWTGAAWQFSNMGASTRVIRDGDIDGWSWGNGSGAPPDAPAGVLDPPTPTPLPPTFTPTPVQATNTPRPTVTRAPTNTPVPEDTPAPNAIVVATSPPAVATPPPPVPPVAGATTATTPDADVAGAQATPRPATTPIASGTEPTRTPSTSPTARSGVIVVDPTQARDNAETAEQSDDEGASGGTSALIGFSVVAIVLVGGAGAMLYRRRSLNV